MKYFRQALVSSAVLVFASNVFATTQEIINCPPISTVKNSIFTQAKYKDFLGWDMTSNNFDYQGKEWNTMFGLATIDEAKNSSEALKKGQMIFNSLALHEPTQRIEHNITICTYMFTDQYLVVTATPAIDLENSFLAKKK